MVKSVSSRRVEISMQKNIQSVRIFRKQGSGNREPPSRKFTNPCNLLGGRWYFRLHSCSFVFKVYYLLVVVVFVISWPDPTLEEILQTQSVLFLHSSTLLLWIVSRAACISLGKIGSGKSLKNSLRSVATSCTPVSGDNAISAPRSKSSLSCCA